MSLDAKQLIVVLLGLLFLVTLVFVQYMEVARKEVEAGLREAPIVVPASSSECIFCHEDSTPGIIGHWEGSRHAEAGVGCLECHQAEETDADVHDHFGFMIATVVTPRDCSRCHQREAAEFAASHHARGDVADSLDSFLAQTVQGGPVTFEPHSPVPGLPTAPAVNGRASEATGCRQCHGSKVGLMAVDGGVVTVDDLQPDPDGRPTNEEAVARIAHNDDGMPMLHPSTWPNTGIGRINLDGSVGSCSACHSRHDFSPRRARQPENCGKCHLGPAHPQKEIYEESKHGVAYRDLRDDMNLDAREWVLGKDYSQAPTCATCHMSGHQNNRGQVTHDPGKRISWTNRTAVSLLMDTDENHEVVTETDPARRRALVADTWGRKRSRMKDVCLNCHTSNYVNAFYTQYDDFIMLYNEKFAKPGEEIMAALRDQGFLTPTPFDEEVEWTWFYLWHHEGRRARDGASMMAPDYAQWHGMYKVAERFYQELIPQARALTARARAAGQLAQADAADAVIAGILARPEHAWQQGAGGE